MMIRGARLRLTLWYAVIFIPILFTLGGAAYWSLGRSLNEAVDRGVETAVSAWLATAPGLDDLLPIDFEREYDGETADVFLIVIRADGALVANPYGVEADEFVEAGLLSAALRGEPVWATVVEDEERLRALAVPISDGEQITGVVIGGRSLASHDRQLNLLLGVLGGVGAASLLLAVVGGYIVSGRALRPIATAYEHQRRFVGDASHELRSPLAVIRASSELLLREPLRSDQQESVQEILDTSIEASYLVDDLLEIARLDRSDTSRSDATSDAALVVGDVLRHMTPLIEDHGSSFTLGGTSVTIRFDESDLRRTLRALLENSLAHTPQGTAIQIETQTDGADGVILVRDTGSGVPPEALETLFDAFTRIDAARTPAGGHSGLGLAIAERLVARNSGTLSARNHPEGGLEMTIRCRRAD